MKKFIRGILISSLVVFLVGVGFVVAGIVMGVSSGDLKNLIENYVPGDVIEREIHVVSPDDETVTSDGEVRRVEFASSDVSELEMDLLSMDCRMYVSDTDKIIVETSVSEKLLEIKNDKGELNIDCISKFGKNSGSSLVIYLPKDMYLNEFDLSVSGRMKIECPINASKVHLEVGGADFTSESSVLADDFELEVGAGKAEFMYVDAKNISIENGAGKTSMGLTGQKEQYNVKMEIAAGNVSYGSESYSSLAQTFTNRPKDATKNIEIECAAGEVTVTFEKGMDV